MSKPSPENPIPLSPEKRDQEKFEAQVRQAVTEAYQEVATEQGEPNAKELFWKPYCQQFSQALYARLQPLGLNPKYVRINKVPENSPSNLRHHILLAAQAPSGEDYFIDGTWQQLIDTPNEKTGLMLEPAKQVLTSAAAKSAPKEIKEIWETGLCMLEARQLVNKANPGLKLKIKNAVLSELNIAEKDYEHFLNLVSNFRIERAKQILEIIKKTQ